MRRLDGFSAFMVYNDVPRCYQHTLKIAILDWSSVAGGYCFDKLKFRLQEWIDALPILQWRVKRVPFGLNHPVWVQDVEFNKSYHIRRIACPAPGDEKTFNQLVSELYAQPLDKSRPLWMLWVVEGLEGGKVGLVCLFHHAIADGAGAGMIFQRLMSSTTDFEPLDSRALGVDPSREPTVVERFVKGVLELPVNMLRVIPPLMVAVFKQQWQIRKYRKQGKLLPPSPKSAPDSILNTIYSHGRTFGSRTFSLPEVRAICKHFGVTINDLLVAIAAGAVRRHYLDMGLAADDPLVAAIPVNIRSAEEETAVLGNYVSNSFMSFPIHLGGDVERLQYAHLSGNAMKDQLQAMGGEGLLKAMELTPPITADIINWALRRTKGQLKLFGNVAISNVRGNPKPMYLAGAKVVKWLSIGQVLAGIGLNITAWSYTDQFNICVMAEEKVIPDGEKFLDYLMESYNEYKQYVDQQIPVGDLPMQAGMN
jgi:diacylglycerol O-acyltransferase / wax synthase